MCFGLHYAQFVMFANMCSRGSNLRTYCTSVLEWLFKIDVSPDCPCFKGKC